MSREFVFTKDGFYELDYDEMRDNGSYAGCGCVLYILFWIIAATVMTHWGEWFPTTSTEPVINNISE